LGANARIMGYVGPPRGGINMNRFDTLISWGARVIVAVLVTVLGMAGAQASLISKKNGWNRLSLFEK
jgi:hypothetical protein